MVLALNADWLTAVVYQTVCHGNDQTFLLTALYVQQNSLQSRQNVTPWPRAKYSPMLSTDWVRTNPLCVCVVVSLHFHPAFQNYVKVSHDLRKVRDAEELHDIQYKAGVVHNKSSKEIQFLSISMTY